MKKRIALLLTLTLLALTAFGCGNSDQNAATDNGVSPEQTKITIGVTAGPHEIIMNKVAELAAAEGLAVNVIVFSDYIQPNTQLAEGALDMNSMQHLPFLESTIADKNYELSNIGYNILIPMCILSEKVDNLADAPDGATVGIPNDTTNQARALNLLQAAGLIELNDPSSSTSTPADIKSNPHQINFVELEAGMLLPALPDFDYAVINSNYVVDAGLVPSEEALFVEPTENNPWVNIFACRTADVDNPAYQKLVAIYQTDEVAQFIAETYPGDAVLAAW